MTQHGGFLQAEGSVVMATLNAMAKLVCAGLALAFTLLAPGARAQGVSFIEPARFETENGSASVAVGDFNGDGFLDLAVANADSDNISVLLGNGDGSFQVRQDFTTARVPVSVVVADFNGDGLSDLAVANVLSGNVSVLLGNGDGSFQAARH